jgi:CRISPR system Cascade subunit CasE
MSLLSPKPNSPPLVALHLTKIMVYYDDAIRLLHIRDTYDWHQRVWQAFKGYANSTRNFLIRIDRKEEAYRVLILSSIEPTKPDWCPTGCFETKTIPEGFYSYTRYRFSLLANPTKKMRVINADGNRKKNGRRQPITQRTELIEWLQRKAQDGGFKINSDSISTVPRGREYFHKDNCSHGVHNAVEFQGELSIENPLQFRQTLASGIGSAKAFGFGLLILDPISN